MAEITVRDPRHGDKPQARIRRDFAAQLHQDAETLGLDGRTDIVKAALEMLHRRAAEERMARSADEFYDGETPPLPIGVVADDESTDSAAAGPTSTGVTT